MRPHAQRNVTTYGNTGDDRFADAELVEKFAVHAADRIDGMIVGIEGGIAVARHVRRDDAIAEFDEMRELRKPEVLVMTKAVQKQDRRAAAAVVI